MDTIFKLSSKLMQVVNRILYHNPSHVKTFSNDTEYLLHNPHNAKILLDSIKEFENDKKIF